jgi:hypothetical protein
MKKGILNKSWLLIPLVAFACTSSQQTSDEPIIDTDAVDQELAQLDQAPEQDETNSGFNSDVLPPESNLGETTAEEVPPSTDSFDSSIPTESTPPIAAVDQAIEVPTEMVPPTPKKVVALTKVELVPFRQGEFLLNAVYIARPKDTFKRISEKIYGSTARVKDLKLMNPKVSKINVGTKIYYNSPTRPQDESNLKVYYEDMGMIPQTYISQSSEPLKAKAKELLGFDNAWKEIWSTHPRLESKTSLPAGSEIYYWPDFDMVAPKVDMAAPAPETAQPEMTNETVPPEMTNNEFPPPPMPEAAPPGSDNLANNDYPPPPMPEMDPPPSLPAAVAGIEEDASAPQDETMLLLGGIGVLTAGIAGLIVVRKRRQQKEAAALAAMENTHIGS